MATFREKISRAVDGFRGRTTSQKTKVIIRREPAISLVRSDWASGLHGHGGSHGFAGAAINHLTDSLANWSAAVNADLDSAIVTLRARGRHLSMNTEFGKRFLSLCAMNIVGRANPKLQVKAYYSSKPNKPPTLDKAVNASIEAAWEAWGKSADITGRHKSLPAFWRTAVKAAARDGESLIRIVIDKRLPNGIGLQGLEADRLDETINRTLGNGNTVRQGVEMDSMGRAVAYYIRSAHPGENYAVGTQGGERVPAENIIHLFLPERFEQVRGYTWMHAVIIRASTTGRFEDAAVTAAEIGASKIAVLQQRDDGASLDPHSAALGMADSTSDGTAYGIPQMSVGAGEMITAPAGYEIASWNPEYPHANFDSFLKACLRGLAAGLDVATHNLTGDMTEVNYSSARIAELSEREIWMMLQDWFISSSVMPVYERWLSLALLRGDLLLGSTDKPIPPERLSKLISASKFQGRRWSWVDPAKETESNAAGVQLGITSRTRICAEQGEDFEDVLDELTQEREAMAKAGIPTDVKPGTTVQDSPRPSDPAAA